MPAAKLWQWWKNQKNPWKKWGLLVFVVVGVVVLFVIYLALPITKEPETPAEIAAREAEEFFAGEFEEAIEKSDEVDAAMALEAKKREGLRDDRENEMHGNKKVHDDIDAADSIGAVDDAAENGRTGRGSP